MGDKNKYYWSDDNEEEDIEKRSKKARDKIQRTKEKELIHKKEKINQSKKRNILISIISVVVIIAIAAGMVFGFYGYRFNLSKTIATVDRVAIKQSEIDTYMELLKDQNPANFPAASDPGYKTYQINILDSLIQLKLLQNYAKANGFIITKKEIDDAYQNAVKQYPTTSDFEKDLAAKKITVAFLRTEIENQLIINKVIAKVTANIAVSDAEMQKYYTDNKDTLFKVPEQVRVSHILILFKIPSGGTLTDAIKMDALKKITEVDQKLKNGEDFAALAKTYSEDTTSATNGGDIGYISKGQTVAEFENAAFSLKVGEVGGIVETSYGYHIIKVTDHKDPYTKTYDEAKDTIKSYIESDKKNKMWADFIKSLVDKASIVYLTDLKGTLGPQGVSITTNATETATTTATTAATTTGAGK